MAGSVNKVTLLGNLGADPEVRTMTSGGKIVSLNIATSQTWKDQSGARQERTQWHRVVIFNERLGEVAERYLSKGRSVYLEGELRSRKYTNKDGIEVTTTEVVIDRFRGDLVLLGGRGDSNGETFQGSGSSSAPAAKPAAASKGGWDTNELDDDIPF